MDSGASYPFIRETAVAHAHAVPEGRHLTLERQTHKVDAEVIALVLVEFFRGRCHSRKHIT
jgi:hypothetical protein